MVFNSIFATPRERVLGEIDRKERVVEVAKFAMGKEVADLHGFVLKLCI